MKETCEEQTVRGGNKLVFMDFEDELRIMVRKDADRLVDKIRSYSTNQFNSWRRTPLLSLEADGRSGFSDRLSGAYRDKVWKLPIRDNNGHTAIGVDLRNGNLISIPQFYVNKKITPAKDKYVIQLALDLEVINSYRINQGLIDYTNTPYSAVYVAEEQEAWRESMTKLCGLEDWVVRYLPL